MLLGEPAGGVLLDSVPTLRARGRVGAKPLLHVSRPYVEEWVKPTRRIAYSSVREEVKRLWRSAWLPRTFPDGLPPLPIERVVEREPRTVRDLLPRGAPLEVDGTWLMPDTWPHFLDGARGAALMTRDSDALDTVSADARIFVSTCIKCFKSVDTRREPCSGDAYRKQVDVFCVRGNWRQAEGR